MGEAQNGGHHKSGQNQEQALSTSLPQSENQPLTGDSLLVRFSEEAHIGKRKKEQQDYHGHLELAADPTNGRPACYLFVVADGVSMGQAGALASQTAVETLLEDFEKALQGGQTDLSAALATAFAAANLEVYHLAQTRPGMATTCVAVLITGSNLITAHVGDSRVYLARPGNGLKPITVDHSWVVEMGELMVQEGHMSAQDLLRDSRRHTITRAFGLETEIKADINLAPLEPGNLVIACTDGLWDLLPPEMLQKVGQDPAIELTDLSRKLVDTALAAGGRDNITLTLARIVSLGQPAPLPALETMLVETAQDLAERTRPLSEPNIIVTTQPAVQPKNPPLPKPYQPIGVVDQPGSEFEADEIEDVPSLKLSNFNPEKLLSNAQKDFALGNWDEAIDSFIELEQLEASYHGLFESFSNSLVRYIGVAIGEGRVDQAELLIKRLEAARVNRYNELLADYCNEESRRAASTRHYPAARAYSLFCLRLRPNDTRARTLSELSDLYLALQRPGAPLAGRLALAQKIYARDETFGAIQDDLARIYLEMGDEAVKNQVWEDAASWYSMIAPLRPSDSQLLSLALGRQRSLEDGSAQRPTTPPPSTTPGLPQGGNATLRATERERAINEGRPEHEMLNRLKDRVSRAQKAWDGGRKEVGAEYIYLVDQLNELLQPNPWQQTFPRVVYDYAKWLLEQKQFEEARPYFQKAHNLGMTAAQQRISEIDRALRERTPGGRGPTPLDLPENSRSGSRNGLRAADDRSGTVTNMASVFTPRRPAPTGPMVNPRPEQPSEVTSSFGGISAPDETPLSSRPDHLNNGNGNDAQGLPPRMAAAIASGNWSQGLFQDVTAQATGANSEATDPEITTAAASGTLRQPNSRLAGDPLQEAAVREFSRLAGSGQPQSLNPRQAARHRLTGFMSLLKSLALPGLALAVIIGAILLILLVILPNVLNKTASDSTSTAAVLDNATATAANPTPTAPALDGIQGVVRIEGGAKVDDLKVFLATAGDPNSPFREFTQEGTFFRLPTTTLNRLDPRQKYIVVVRPKSTADRQYAENLPPDNAFQQPFTRADLTFDPLKGFDTTIRILPESLAFFPLKGAEADQDVPGGRYFGAFRHSLRGDYLKFYNANGGLVRFGFPISEEFDWATNGRVQFFERGWLAADAPGKPISVGKVGKALLDSTCNNIQRLPANITPLAVPTLKPDQDFAAFATNFKLGPPQTQSFDPQGTGKLKIQYFEQGRLELNPADKKAISLGLLGSEYARCIGWLK